MPGRAKPNFVYPLGGYGHLHTRLQEVNEFENVDILFLGSSHSYRGFDVRIFEKHGWRVFNLGSSSQTPIQTQILLERYLDTLNPKLVVYAVSQDLFTSDGTEPALDIIANDKMDIKNINMALKINNIKVYNALIYRIARDLLRLDSNFQEPICKEDDTYISGGFVEKSPEFSPEKPKRFILESDMTLLKHQLESFENIISLLEKRNIDYIFVRTPILRSYYDSFATNEKFDAMMHGYGKYYNYNEILDLDDFYFYDRSHLNQKGVELFSTELLHGIDSSGILK